MLLRHYSTRPINKSAPSGHWPKWAKWAVAGIVAVVAVVVVAFVALEVIPAIATAVSDAYYSAGQCRQLTGMSGNGKTITYNTMIRVSELKKQ